MRSFFYAKKEKNEQKNNILSRLRKKSSRIRWNNKIKCIFHLPQVQKTNCVSYRYWRDSKQKKVKPNDLKRYVVLLSKECSLCLGIMGKT